METNKSFRENFITGLQRNKIYPYLWILAVVPFVLIYKIYPMIFSGILSFFEWNGFESFSRAEFVGIKNYTEILKDDVWWITLKNTSIYVVMTLVIQNLIGYLMALVLFYSGIKGSKVIRAVVFFPAVLAPAVVGLIWKIILSKDGLLNIILTNIGLEQFTMLWLANKVTPIFMVGLVHAWQWTGYNMIFYLAGLQTVPQDLVDASKIDGASWFQTVKNVVTPIITPVITIVIILNIIGGFRVFDLVYIMTSGGPARASEVISTYIVWNAFSSTSAGYYGYASALSMYLIFITAIFVYLRVRLTRRSEEEIE